ncbi:hypothetical protein YC2023_060463 [Brassica napus]
MSGYEQELTIPFFCGKIDTEAYLDWEKKMEFLFGLQYYTEKKKVCLAVNGLCGSAFSWWQRVSQARRFEKKPQIISWVEMKTLMKKRFVSQWKLPKLKSEAATKLTTLDQPAYWSELPLKPAERRSVVPVLSLKQEEEKLQASILASPIKQIEESHKTEPEPTTLCLKLEEEAEVAEAECGHVPDQIKQEEKVPGGSSKALELVLPTVEQGDNFKSLACELLTRPLVCLQLSLVEHLRVVKGLQQVVFEPGGSSSVSIRSNNNLVQKTFTYKLDLQGFFTPEKQDLSSILKNMKSRKEGARKWIMTRPDELYGKPKGLIHEVLGREKAMGLDVAFIKHGLTLNNHGRPVTTLIDKEMDRMKLVRQEMEWEIQSDRQMDWSNRHMRELSWKWKIENQSRKWNMMRTFIIQMSIRSSLVGLGTRWIEPKKELFEKGLYRPKKWKDKPAWIMIGPI